MIKKEQIVDTIECLKSCIADEKRREEEGFLTDFERGAIFGRIDGYEKAIEVLEYILKGK